MEIIDSMLRSIESGASKTQISRRAAIWYSQLREYLILLEGNALVKYEEGSRQYRITQRGLRFMDAYDKIGELIPRPGTKLLA